jgi:hypothetical protein
MRSLLRKNLKLENLTEVLLGVRKIDGWDEFRYLPKG